VEALRKLTIVHNKRHAFTTDSDNSSDGISAEIEQQLRAKTLNNNLSDVISKMTSVQPIPSKSTISTKNNGE